MVIICRSHRRWRVLKHPRTRLPQHIFAGIPQHIFAGIPLLVATGHSVRGLRQEEIKGREKAYLTLIGVMSLVVLLALIGEGAAGTFLNVYLDREQFSSR